MDLFKTLTIPELLSLLIFNDARREPPVTKLAVAHAVLNAALISMHRGKDLKSFLLLQDCFQDGNHEKQVLHSQANTGYYDPACLCVAHLALAGHTQDPTDGAVRYHSIALGSKAFHCDEDTSGGDGNGSHKNLRFTKRMNRIRFYSILDDKCMDCAWLDANVRCSCQDMRRCPLRVSGS